MSDEVDKLTAAMAAGDQAAIETFYRRYFDLLYAEARRATRRDEAFCLDVVQDSVLRVIRSIRPVSSESRLATWLRLVVRTAAYDLLRAEQRRQRREQLALVSRDDGEAPDQDQLEWLKREIEALDPLMVRTIELRFEHRWTLGRIARFFGVSIGTIDGRLRRALIALRQRAKERCDE